METLEMPATMTDMEIEEMLRQITDAPECKCESAHFAPVAICSGEVVARKHIGHSGKAFNICKNSYDWNVIAMSIEFHKCDSCGMPLTDCWSLVPV
jgi:hypothetical protein